VSFVEPQANGSPPPRVTRSWPRDILQFLQRERVRSVILVTPQFRSRRTQLAYDRVLGGTGIVVRYQPVEVSRSVKTWTDTWHGIQEVGEEWGKLQYYRFYVLPFRAGAL